METSKAYNKLLNEVENLQNDLMDIEDYSEEVYQAFQKVIDELEYQIEEG
ncbi:hypothetical protein LOS22_15110 [Enterococcus faecium]|nr:hypothetical protein [Enterococcus faecium]